MIDWQRGTQVLHSTLGLGRVVAAEPGTLHVFFLSRQSRFAAKLRLPAASRFLRAGDATPDAWLAGLEAFEFDEREGRWGLAMGWLTLDEAIERYLARHPRGFHRPAQGAPRPGGVPDRRARWATAAEAWRSQLGGGEAERLLEDGQAAVVVRRLVRLERMVSPLLGEPHEGGFEEALQDGAAAVPYLCALLPALAAPDPGKAKVEALFRVARGLPGSSAQRWLLASLPLFLASPERHVLVRPRATAHALRRLGHAVELGGDPAWATYAALRSTSTQLLEALAPHGASDFADVESFLHATASAKPPDRSPGPVTPRPKARPRSRT
jgi:hypothetical protein